MNAKQHDSIVKYLYDLSKALLLAAAVGIAAGRLGVAFASFYLLLGAYAFVVALHLEGLSA